MGDDAVVRIRASFEESIKRFLATNLDMSYKLENKKAYNLYARKFEEKFKQHFEENVRKEADLFLAHLPGKEIIDVGSGPGNHALYFKEKGGKVLCVDFSESMLQLCAEKGLDIKFMDIEQWDLAENSADGIWAYASLLHLPRDQIPEVIQNIQRTLHKEGMAFIAVKQGLGAEYEIKEKYSGTKRYFTYFSKEEMRGLLIAEFEIISESTLTIKEQIFLHYLLRLKK